MGEITDRYNSAFRDYAVDGVPASGDHEPIKTDIRAIGPAIEAAIAALQQGIKRYATKALMDADTDEPDGTLAYVYDDPTPANNTYYNWADPGPWAVADWYLDLIEGPPGLMSAATGAEVAAGDRNDVAATPLALDASGLFQNAHSDALGLVAPLYERLGIPLPASATVSVIAGPDGRPALLDYHEGLGLRWLNGRHYPTKEQFFEALLAVDTGDGSIIAGPYLDPTGFNHISNTLQVIGDSSGWGVAGGTVDVVNDGGSNALQVTKSSGSTIAAYTSKVATSRAFKFSGEFRRGGAASGAIGASANITSALGGNNGTTTSGTAYVASSVIASATDTNIVYVGPRITGAGTGTYFMRLPTMVEVWPFAGFEQENFTLILSSTTPAAGAGTEVFWQFDSDSARDRARYVYDHTAGLIRFILTAANLERGNLTVAKGNGLPFVAAASVGNDDLDVSYDGDEPQAANNVAVAGYGMMRLFRSFTGEAYTGSKANTRFTVVGGKSPGAYLRHRTAGKKGFNVTGDSYMAGAGLGAGSFRVALEGELPTYKAISTAVGGQNIWEILDLFLAAPYLWSRPLIGWDGGLTLMTAEDYLRALGQIDRILTPQGVPWVWLPPICPPPMTGVANAADPVLIECQTITNMLGIEFGSTHIWDPIPSLQTLAVTPADLDDVSKGFPPRSAFMVAGVPIDGTHMPQASHDHVADDLVADGILDPLLLAMA